MLQIASIRTAAINLHPSIDRTRVHSENMYWIRKSAIKGGGREINENHCSL